MFCPGFFIPAMPYSRINLNLIHKKITLVIFILHPILILTGPSSGHVKTLVVYISWFLCTETDLRFFPARYNDPAYCLIHTEDNANDCTVDLLLYCTKQNTLFQSSIFNGVFMNMHQ